MSLAPPGTLARKRQQAGVDAAALQMKACAHVHLRWHETDAQRAEGLCRDCGALRRLFARHPTSGKWMTTWRAT